MVDGWGLRWLGSIGVGRGALSLPSLSDIFIDLSLQGCCSWDLVDSVVTVYQLLNRLDGLGLAL